MTGIVVWLTGLPSSGKTTNARRLHALLVDQHLPCVVLDGDQVRACLTPSPGHSAAEREAVYRTLANLAGLIAEQGVAVVVPATAHLRRYRDFARHVAAEFLEVYVKTPLATCEARDDKGLYRAAREGFAPSLPGVGAPFEEPINPDAIIELGDEAAGIAALAETISKRLTTPGVRLSI